MWKAKTSTLVGQRIVRLTSQAISLCPVFAFFLLFNRDALLNFAGLHRSDRRGPWSVDQEIIERLQNGFILCLLLVAATTSSPVLTALECWAIALVRQMDLSFKSWMF